jgi:hypothetical protein
MTLGRTESGAIKIKTDEETGEVTAVACACCGGCLCGSATPINPPSDPNFTKKLNGNDPNVAPFTQVSINYSITVTLPGSPPASRTASGTMHGSWVDAIVHRCADYIGGPYTDPSSYLEINRVFEGNNCSFDDFCFGNCGRNSETSQGGIGSVYLRLRSDGCLIAILSEEYFGGYFYISKECPDKTLANAGISISINGVSTYIVYEDRAGPNDTLAGFLSVTFS